jgi:hypothetical protein
MAGRVALNAPKTVGADPSLPGPTGYYMRERRRVTILDPVARTLANGRTAVTGTCASCAGRVTALAAQVVPSEA